METMIGVALKEFVMLAADTSTMRSIAVLKDDECKLFRLTSHTAVAAVGDPGDKTQFVNYVSKNMSLYQTRHQYELSPADAAHYTRRVLTDSLRSSKPYQVKLLLGGWDEEHGPVLYFLDYLGSLVQTHCYATGYGGAVCLTLLDRYRRHGDLTVEQGYDLLQNCVHEIRKRYVVNLANFKVQMIGKDGILDLPDINVKPPSVPIKPSVF